MRTLSLLIASVLLFIIAIFSTTTRAYAFINFTPPFLSGGSPSGTLAAGTRDATLSVTTDGASECRYSTTIGTDYDFMVNTMVPDVDNLVFTVSLTGLTDGTSYNYYIRCISGTGNANLDDYTVSFSVALPPQATTYTLTGPTTGTVAKQSDVFTVTPSAYYTGTITITPSGTGLSTPIILTFSNSSAPQTFTVTPADYGTLTLTPTNSGTLTNPAHITYEVPKPSRRGSAGAIARMFYAPTNQNGPVAQPPTPTTRSPFSFTKNLSVGMHDVDVVQLQKFLNAHNFSISSMGPGSIGNETNFFGRGTKAALIRYQISKGIKPANGNFGPTTRDMVNNELQAVQ